MAGSGVLNRETLVTPDPLRRPRRLLRQGAVSESARSALALHRQAGAGFHPAAGGQCQRQLQPRRHEGQGLATQCLGALVCLLSGGTSRAHGPGQEPIGTHRRPQLEGQGPRSGTTAGANRRPVSGCAGRPQRQGRYRLRRHRDAGNLRHRQGRHHPHEAHWRDQRRSLERKNRAEIAGVGRMKSLLFTLMLTLAAPLWADEATPVGEDPVIEQRMVILATDLRCLVCQNESLAGSHAELAEDLRKEIRAQMKAGKNDKEVIEYLTTRYGDFVLYRPPFKPITYLLWLGPLLFLGLGGAIWYVTLKKRRAFKDVPVDEQQLAEAAQLLDDKN